MPGELSRESYPPNGGLPEDESIVLTVLMDGGAVTYVDGLYVEHIAAATAWPGARTFGVGRTRRALRALVERGYVRRQRQRFGAYVYWTVVGGDG